MTLSRWFLEHRACFSIVAMAEPKAKSRGRPKKSTECEAAAVEPDVEVVIESSSKALKTTNSCTSLGKVICCLTIRNRLLHEWYCSRSLPYVSQLNAQIAGHERSRPMAGKLGPSEPMLVKKIKLKTCSVWWRRRSGRSRRACSTLAE